jgi:hypothetical protein
MLNATAYVENSVANPFQSGLRLCIEEMNERAGCSLEVKAVIEGDL